MARPRTRRITPQKRRYAKARARGKNCREAGRIAGLKGNRALKKGVTQAAWEKDPRVQMLIAEEIRRDMDEGELSNILAAQARGIVPTKIVRGDRQRTEYDTRAAGELVGKMLGAFSETHRIEFAASRDAALLEVQELLAAFGVEASIDEIAQQLEGLKVPEGGRA